ncbi:MAG: TolC family protein, partial [Pseudomonadota bacterium]|nr:TolC family protein [Pseudomonadota bacterium]
MKALLIAGNGQVTRMRASCAASILLCTLALGACQVGPDFVQPPNALNAAILQPRDHTTELAANPGNVPAQWWILFGDPVLSELQRRAQQGNADLQLAATRIAESRAELGIAAAQALPHASAGAAYSRDGLSGNGRFAALGAPRQPNDFWQAGFDTSWELDLWGHAWRTREGAVARLEAAAYERE